MILELPGAPCTGLFCRWKMPSMVFLQPTTSSGRSPGALQCVEVAGKPTQTAGPESGPCRSPHREHCAGKVGGKHAASGGQVWPLLLFSITNSCRLLRCADPDQRPMCTSVPGLGGYGHGEAWNPLSTPSNSTQRVQLAQIWVIKTESESHGITCCRQTRRPGREFPPASAR